jgi:hypothetical protein
MEYGNVPPPSQVMSKKFKKFILKIVLALSGLRKAQRAQKHQRIFWRAAFSNETLELMPAPAPAQRGGGGGGGGGGV